MPVPDPGTCPTLAVPEISENAGCVVLGSPAVLMALTHLCETEVRDSTPPKVEADGVGSCAAGKVPVVRSDADTVTFEESACPLTMVLVVV